MSRVQTQTEWEEEMSVKILQFIHNELYLELRFMERALSALQYRRIDGLLAFATDGIFLYYSSEPTLRIFQKNTLFLDRAYLHTVLHCLFRQLWMRGNRESSLWNLACDISVEYTIDSLGKACTKRVQSWLRLKTYEELKQRANGSSAAVVCRWLAGKTEEERQELAREFYTDDHRFWPKEEEQNMPVVRQTRQNWDKLARQTALEQRRRGDDAKEGEEAFAEQLQAARSRRSYGDFLKKFSVLQEELHCDPEEFDLGFYSYGLRLYGNMPLIEPVETREVHKIREFVIVVDTSYSTSGALISGFLQETFQILSQKNSFFERFCIRVLQCDHQVQKDELVTNEEELRRLMADFTIAGGGSTDFRPAFSYVEKLREQGKLKRPDGLLYFTDGKGIYPEKKPDYKTAFLFLDDYDDAAVPPWAMRMQLEPEDLTHEH